MDQSISSRSVRLQQKVDQQLAQAMIGPLKSGLCSFDKVLEMLLRVKADIILPECQTFDDIRNQTENMKQQMEKSEQAAKKHLQQLDKETEELTAEQGHLENEKKQKDCKLKDLKIQLESHNNSLKNYTEALKTAKRSLTSAEESLDSMRRKREEAEKIRDAGIGLLFIPFVGWIAGSIMIGVGEKEMKEASDHVNSAKGVVHSCERQVRSYSDKVSEYKSLIHQAESDIKDTDNKIHEMKAMLQVLSKKREAVTDLQAKMRTAVHQLGLLCGVGSVAELQTRHMILLEPVMKVMEEMMTALGKITGDDLLHSEGIKSLMKDLKMNMDKLKQVAHTKS